MQLTVKALFFAVHTALDLHDKNGDCWIQLRKHACDRCEACTCTLRLS